ncbi:trifunctional transcriptional regulator/proline dehydrogenase/L-glutamate gamma-semialdehyde dehydrogenase [Azospirillum halopraeferens]|uniref:trifunctional transcriptional regulator/proline dehydrogenase/L-glutamate gamma-semialdehyde dehydrogenase n=1 Tax=Azospirillum halopraeferens TaxID=34010 RepID=UPI0004266327|nr:trifunctional transcriptional regulator/proline dehydrogenase/L-glutamate gamma-semialdehyde dehydrogenase [Azospirillum halopraeferens]
MTSTAVSSDPAPPADPRPFASFAGPLRRRDALRDAVTAACRVPEPVCVPPLIARATLPPEVAALAESTARRLVTALRAKPPARGVDGLIREFSLSSDEGVALMCLAEALLRIPDAATRDALIRDKIAGGNWRAHLGSGRSLFVNAATWGLLVTGRLTAAAADHALSSALTRLIARGGEPLIRRGVDFAIRLLGERFVAGRTIAEAIAHGRRREAAGFRHSYDMLGEAALTAADAERYRADYETAIHAIGAAAAGAGPIDGPGISIKLSALHPRYARAKAERVMAELLPVLADLARLAKRYGIGLNIDAEEADRLELSLDLLEALCFDPELAGWDGLGFVVQAYGKRCPAVIDLLIDLARRSGRRLMVRLVKGAYWDAEIKRAQVDGLADFPVYTRKVHTDVAYVACARALLAAPDAVFPQFATHNARTLATVHALAGEAFRPGDYEFQCLYGMGEGLYEEVVGPMARPCRIYAPVGTHETLLAYLVRRLLENGANSSFVNRIADPAVPVEELVTDPVDEALAITPPGSPHPRIALPRVLYGAERANAAGLDLADEAVLGTLAAALAAGAAPARRAAPLPADGEPTGPAQPVRNPADHRDVVGSVVAATAADVAAAFARAADAAPAWAATPPAGRAAALGRAADALEARTADLIGLLIREAGKTAANAVAEVREAVDFLRYYGARAAQEPLGSPLGPVVCISPWNFPLAIFTGQVAAALAAGNPVLAKPAEETPLVAAEAVRILHAAGVPPGAVQLLPGDGTVGAALVAHPATRGVLFTGSTEVARLIRRSLAGRGPDGAAIPLIAETGGQNALIVDSSALAEQVVADALASAFDSAGQRCSALRILCVQEEVADRTLAMLRGAMAELSVGNPDRLATDVGPVITAGARDGILRHIEAMRARGRRVEALPLPPETARGTFVAPTLIEIDRVAELEREVFGPVLHVLRYRRDGLERLLDDLTATGYALTFGLHTRIDATVERVVARAPAGNLYINRTIVGAVVGVQPFGGHGLSGTGPKAGGPLYLHRLTARRPAGAPGLTADPAALAPARAYTAWLRGRGHAEAADRCEAYAARSALGATLELPGPVGERNLYTVRPRGCVRLLPETAAGLLTLFGAVLATGNDAVVEVSDTAVAAALDGLPADLAARLRPPGTPVAAALAEGDAERLAALDRRLAEAPGPLVALDGPDGDPLWLLEERVVSINTTAAGGNASLMAMG